jgi:transcriptional regulator with XRE-family HTH domain
MIKTTDDSQYQTLLEYLKNARAKKGFTVRDVAELIDESFQFVSKIETGQRRLTVHEYVQYCQALGVDPVKGLKLLY